MKKRELDPCGRVTAADLLAVAGGCEPAAAAPAPAAAAPAAAVAVPVATAFQMTPTAFTATAVTASSLTHLRMTANSYQYSVAIAGSFAPDGTPIPPVHIVQTAATPGIPG
jgi:hypothetical protein